MTVTARDRYLESQVLTATPQKLRLMLIEGALRFARQIVPAWESDDFEGAFEAVSRSRKIIAELLSVMSDDGSEIVTQLRGIYQFLFRHLTEAQLQKNPDMIGEVIRLLEVERDTWQLVCEQMPEAPERDSRSVTEEKQEITASTSAPVDSSNNPPAGGFSLDA